MVYCKSRNSTFYMSHKSYSGFVHDIFFDVRMIYNALGPKKISHISDVCAMSNTTPKIFRVQYEYAQFGKPVFVWLSFEIERYSSGKHLPVSTSLISKSGAFYANTEGIVNACTKKLVSTLMFNIKTFMTLV